MYAKLERDGSLTMADVKRFRDMDRFVSRVVAHSKALSKDNLKAMQKLLEDTYDLSYSYLSHAVQLESDVLLQRATPHLPEILDKVMKNKIYGLKLSPAQERDRKLIVKGINGAVETGLKKGGTYGEIAREIQKEFNSSYKRAVTIAHTETHRVREQATSESAMNAHRQGIIMEKIWRNMGDERVRPGRGIGKAPRKGGADHKRMEGQTRLADEMFDLIPSGQADSPGNSGIASQDIRCRCYASYRVKRIDKQSAQQRADNLESDFKTWKAAQ